MFRVNDKETARKAYEAIRMFSALNDDVVKGMIADIKRNLREWTHKPSNIFDGNIQRRIVKDDGIDGFVELVTLPDDIDNVEYAEKFFHENVYMECRPSMYDCTGQLFTSWYKLFKRGNRFFAYHSVACDV